ncbi:MAG: hypothetical protein ACOYOK_08680 [Pseudobdellovibrionaceae bacterium]
MKISIGFILAFLLQIGVYAQNVSVTKNKIRKVNQAGFGLGFALWNENLKLLGVDQSYKMKAIAYGGVLNYRKNYYTISDLKSWGWRYELMGLAGQINVSQDSADLTYFKRGSPFLGAGASLGLFWMPPGKRSATFGLNFPLIYRYTKFSNPDSSTAFETSYNIIAGVGLDMSWNLFGRWWLQQSINTGYGLRDTLWLVSLQWNRL